MTIEEFIEEAKKKTSAAMDKAMKSNDVGEAAFYTRHLSSLLNSIKVFQANA